ncbi:hypothetical protein TTHT_0787 [Thermotomaculum hydrothermale]|uniref:Uncharacterized protein n=1 Tax=Thermotomaculum hydrothermale TaxID=981385 RepID=A0A7R6PZ62_9BACT|nr:hypothetical protein [Thermotomaculum hydrothermale]BBB32353.1 hypothetical protein TTHT_0787 [Thermotomaculum hydrothermale]
MKNKRLLIVLFLFAQFLFIYFFKLGNVQYFLLAESIFFYLIIKDIIPFVALLPYFLINVSVAFVVLLFIFLFHFLKAKVKIPAKLSIIFFLILYFFTARYEVFLIKAVMPGFIAFVAIIYAITRMTIIQRDLSPALFLYTVVGFLYSVLFNLFPFFKSEPYLMFSIDAIQIVIALILFYSFKDFLEKKSPDSDNKHNESNA